MKDVEKVKLSIIVPVFNVEEYLPECIESILKQTMTTFELILVDDCSPDKSGVICDNYARKDSRIKVIHKEQREGSAKARFTGLDASHGRYIGFVDADDTISKDMYHTLYLETINQNVDIVCCGFIRQYKNKEIVIDNSGEKKILNRKQTIKYMHTRQGVYGVLWNKIFKRELLESVVDEDEIIIGEDYKLVLEAVNRSSNIIHIKKALYFYRQRKSSVLNSGFTDKHKTVLQNYQTCRDNLLAMYPEASKEIISWCFGTELLMLFDMERNQVYEQSMIKALHKDISKHFITSIKVKELSILFKMSGILVVIHPKLFFLIMRCYRIYYKEKKYILYN